MGEGQEEGGEEVQEEGGRSERGRQRRRKARDDVTRRDAAGVRWEVRGG